MRQRDADPVSADRTTRAGVRGALMVCGTTSNAGKSTVVSALCRLLARDGVRVAPFKAQNMALNSAVTASGHEIGRAQAAQAFAAGVEPEVAMNPVLLKPTGDRTSQVVVEGRPFATMSAAEYHAYKPQLLPLVLGALADLRARFDVVVCEGAGSPAEINLLEHDIVNLRIAHEARLPAIVVGDIDPGGVFAALYGTVALLPDHYRTLVRGFVLNKFRGDPALLLDGCADLRARCGVPTLGILPWLGDVELDAEDSLALRAGTRTPPAIADALDVAVVGLPRIANFTDLDPLVQEPGVHVRFVRDAAALGQPDLVVVPGTKATVADLAWLRARGLDRALAATTATVLGICGGYQMLGRTIDDPVESGDGVVDGLSLLALTTTFAADKRTERFTGTALGHAIDGYLIHHGRVHADRPDDDPFVVDAHGNVEGVRRGHVFGVTVHGLFEADEFRRAFLTMVGERAGKTFVPGGQSFAALRQARVERLADAFEAHVDVDAVVGVLASAAPATAVKGAR
jgi:adenosylcobyric acid synthase